MAMRRAMTWTHGDASKTSARQTAGRKAIPMTWRAMSPVPGMPTATATTVRERSARSPTRRATARPSAMTVRGAWYSMWTATAMKSALPTTWTGIRCLRPEQTETGRTVSQEVLNMTR